MPLNLNRLSKIAKFLISSNLSSPITLQDFHAKALTDYGINDFWPEVVQKEVKNKKDNITKETDVLETFPFVTIDGEDAKDFDDAIFCEFSDNGFHLKVAIADVSFYVKEGSALDLEAAKRTTSVYMPKKVVPMLPEKLSNELCSLQPNKRRRCLCIEMDFDKDGYIRSYKFHRGIIKSVARLTYTEVENQIINGVKDSDYAESLKAAIALFNKLLINKGYRGALDFTISEPFIQTNSNGDIKHIDDRKRLNSHKLIEEFMLAANISAADFIKDQMNLAVKQGAKMMIDESKFDYPKEHKNYMIPQVLTNVNHEMKFMMEETFGPCVGIMPVDNDNEGVNLMNDSPYGLTASIWTKDIDVAEKLGNKVNTGTLFMNRCDYLDPGLSWTGVKETGKGCSLSEIAYEHLTKPKSFHLKKEL